MDQAASSRLQRPETRERMDMIDRGEIRYNPETGWQPGEDVNSKINQRSRDYSNDTSRKDAKTLMRAEKGVHKPFAGKDTSVMGHNIRGNWSVGDEPRMKSRARDEAKKVLEEQRSMPKPNLPKSEEMQKDDTAPKAPVAKQKHMIFSMDNPAHGQHDDQKHSAMLELLKQHGAEHHEIEGHYGSPERSIIVSNPDNALYSAIEKILTDHGQESYIVSDGHNHKMKFLNGENAGKHVRGQGTQFHEQAPATGFSKTKDGEIFTHNFDFGKLHD